MRFHAALIVLVTPYLFVPTILAVFADEAYQADYHHALLGIPQQHTTFFHRPQSSSRASLLYTLSENLVLGAVNPKDGAIVWRQRLGGGNATAGYLRAGEGENIVISVVGGQVSAWDALSGKSVWANEFNDGEVRDLEVMELEDGIKEETAKDAVVLFAEKDGVVRRLSGMTGDVKWEFRDNSGDLPFQVSTSASSIYYISLHFALSKGYKITVTSLDPVSGRRTGQNTVSSESEVLTPDSILFVGANAASPLIIWTDKAHKVLKVNVIGSKHISTIKIINDSSEDIEYITIHAPHLIHSRSHFLVHYQTSKSHWAEVYHVDLTAATVSKAYSLPRVGGSGAFSTSTQHANVYFTRNTNLEVTLVSSVSHGVHGRWSMQPRSQGDKADLEGMSHAVSEVVVRGGSTYAVRCAVILQSGSWELIRNGEPIWTRLEALTGIMAAGWADLTKEKNLAKELEVEGHGNVLSAYLHRVKRHARDLKHFPAWVRSLRTSIMISFSGNQVGTKDEDLHPDNFGFRKLVIVATKNGRLMALHAADQGKIVWNIKAVDVGAGEKWNVNSIDVNQGFALVEGGAGELLRVNASTGEILQHQPRGSIPSLKTSVSGEDRSGRRVQITIDEDGRPGNLPAHTFEDGTVVVSHDQSGVLQGWSLSQDSKPRVAWEFVPAAGERILSAVGRPRHDPVASLGKVLGDRSVMYKYLNPNLLLITAVSDSSATATFYLVDSISGEILYSTSHTGVDTTRSITSTISENWFTYSLWGDVSDSSTAHSSSKGYHLVLAELFESSIPNDRGPLGSSPNSSSIYPSFTTDADIPKPHAVAQAFLVQEEISNMAVTSTRQGITSRSLLCTLPASNAIVAIPRHVLDPRRPIDRDPTSAEAEEGLFRYSPVIEFDPKWYITHKREVMGIQKVITSPSLLESTSLVFAFGNGGDVFGTRIAPSQAFDILGKGFGKVQLIGTVLALAAGVTLLAPMVRRKQIDARWIA
ncbi:MAG: hypothetical protein M1830_009117 [Pleopsidium flavum]|nr:MAG: hypothetical protein M1830_009117 [Pleopsidium flavum]